MKVKLQEHERLDDLVLDGMKIIQRDDQFCFSLDTVLLAHFGRVPHGPALDLGTGTAAIPLILTARGARQVTGVELNPVMADVARRNVLLNAKDDCITILITAISKNGRPAVPMRLCMRIPRTGKKAAALTVPYKEYAGPDMKKQRHWMTY